MIVWHAQEHPASCVAACVRMALTEFGQHLAEVEIRRMLGNPRFGLTLRQSSVRIEQAGGTAVWHEDWNLDDLRESLRLGDFPIVGIERRFFGHPAAAHAVVLISVSSHQIEYLDPLDGPDVRQTSLDTFLRAWHATGQEALLILSRLPE